MFAIFPLDDDEPYEPGDDSPYTPEDDSTSQIPAPITPVPDIQKNLEEVNRMIEQKKQQIESLAAQHSLMDIVSITILIFLFGQSHWFIPVFLYNDDRFLGQLQFSSK